MALYWPRGCSTGRLWGLFLIHVALLVTVSTVTSAQTTPPPAAGEQAHQTVMSPEQQMVRYTPELRQKVMALSPEVKQALQQLQASHTRQSRLTLRQVMQEILADYQSMAAAVAVENAAQAAESARRLANHRMPDGGLLPYLPLDKITTEALGVLPAMNAVVEGNALRFATAAEQGDMATAARFLGEIATGCVACHQVFRGVPGTSALLAPRPATP